MLTLRPTKMLAKRLKQPLTSAPMAPANLYADWCVHGFNLGPSRWLLFMHTSSRLSALAPARGVTTPAALVRCFGETVHAQLMRCGFERPWERHLAPHLSTVMWLPIPNRSILGSMNELINLSSWFLADLPLEQVNLKLVKVPMKSLGFAYPREKFEALETPEGG